MIHKAIRPAQQNHLTPVEGGDGKVDDAGQQGDGSGNDRADGFGRDDNKNDAVIEAAEEEVQQRVRGLRAPAMPTQAEVEHHRMCGHLPYRPWCPECVEGFGREWPHRATEAERTIPLVSCDYLYITRQGIFTKDEIGEEERQSALRALVMWCHATKTPFADAVPRKDADEDGYVVEQMRQNVIWLGHSKVTLRSDNEPALVQVINRATAALKAAGVESVLEEGSVPYDPQTNGVHEHYIHEYYG